MATVTLLVPTLNEIEGMRIIMPRIDPGWVRQILVVDGGSTDGTAEYARERGYDVVIQDQPGLRKAYLAAWPHIIGDAVITFSPDGNSIPELIPDLIRKFEEGEVTGAGYDMVIASRYLGDAKSDDDDWITAFGNWFYTRSVNFLHGGKYTDVMVMYRIFRKRLADELELHDDRWYRTPERLFFCDMSWEPMLSARAALRKLKVGEIPGDEPARLGGVRKLLIFRWGAAYYFQFIRDFLLWR
ncbi:MAG: glycosyltransferase family 2 protein [Planctomycetaceae bacterium]